MIGRKRGSRRSQCKRQEVAARFPQPDFWPVITPCSPLSTRDRRHLLGKESLMSARLQPIFPGIFLSASFRPKLLTRHNGLGLSRSASLSGACEIGNHLLWTRQRRAVGPRAFTAPAKSIRTQPSRCSFEDKTEFQKKKRCRGHKNSRDTM